VISQLDPHIGTMQGNFLQFSGTEFWFTFDCAKYSREWLGCWLGVVGLMFAVFRGWVCHRAFLLITAL